MSTALPLIIIVVAALLALAAGAFIASRKGYNRPGEVVARCRRGHVFTTVWSAKASRSRLDLGFARIQRCPIGGHWTVVVPVKDWELTAEQKREAKKNRDDAVSDSRPGRRAR